VKGGSKVRRKVTEEGQKKLLIYQNLGEASSAIYTRGMEAEGLGRVEGHVKTKSKGKEVTGTGPTRWPIPRDVFRAAERSVGHG